MSDRPRMTDAMKAAKHDIQAAMVAASEQHDLSYNELLIVIAAASVRFAPTMKT